MCCCCRAATASASQAAAFAPARMVRLFSRTKLRGCLTAGMRLHRSKMSVIYLGIAKLQADYVFFFSAEVDGLRRKLSTLLSPEAKAVAVDWQVGILTAPIFEQKGTSWGDGSMQLHRSYEGALDCGRWGSAWGPFGGLISISICIHTALPTSQSPKRSRSCTWCPFPRSASLRCASAGLPRVPSLSYQLHVALQCDLRILQPKLT